TPHLLDRVIELRDVLAFDGVEGINDLLTPRRQWVKSLRSHHILDSLVSRIGPKLANRLIRPLDHVLLFAKHPCVSELSIGSRDHPSGTSTDRDARRILRALRFVNGYYGY